MLEHSVVLVMSDTGYAVVERNFCGFKWETEVKDSKDHAEIILSCNRGAESSSWQCTAVITVHIPGVSKVVSTFHSKFRSTAIAVPRIELGNDIKVTIGLQDVSGYRDVALFEHDFTRSSDLTNACITFENSDTRVYVIREYLLLNSRRFATLLTRMVPSCETTPVSTSNKSEYSDFDVLSSRTTLTDPLCTEDNEVANKISLQDDDKTTLPSTVCQEDGIYLLRGVSAEDFITLLKAIHPPFAEVTNENVESLLSTAFRLGVEHIVWKCETFLRTEGAWRSFDVFSRLVFATTYEMSALENDCLAALQSVNDVRTMLMDSRMESAPQELRILLLETLFQRLNSEAYPATLQANTVSEASQTCFPLSATSTEVAFKETGPHLCERMARSECDQEEMQGIGKMAVKQEKTTEVMDKKIVNDACATIPKSLQHSNQLSGRGKQSNYWFRVMFLESSGSTPDRYHHDDAIDEVLAKPRRSISDAKKDLDMISDKRKKTNIPKNKVRKLQQQEYDEISNEMSAKIDDEKLLCDAVDHFSIQINSFFDQLSKEPSQVNIGNVEQFQLPALRAELAMLKEKYEEANHARMYVDPDSSRIAALEDCMKTFDSTLEDAKKAEQERAMVIITERLSQHKTLPFLELTEDSLDEMENQLRNLSEDQADELQRQIEDLRNAKKQQDDSRKTSKRRISVPRRRTARKRNPECKSEEYSDFPGLLVCRTINASKLSKKPETVWYGDILFSAHSMFVDLVLPPTDSLKTMVCSFASHYFTKIKGYFLYKSGVYFPEKPQRIPPFAVEVITASMIVGCGFDVQLNDDKLLFDKLKAYLKKQFLDYEHAAKTAADD